MSWLDKLKEGQDVWMIDANGESVQVKFVRHDSYTVTANRNDVEEQTFPWNIYPSENELNRQHNNAKDTLFNVKEVKQKRKKKSKGKGN